MQLHSANDQMTACVNMVFSCPQNYDSLHHTPSYAPSPHSSNDSHTPELPPFDSTFLDCDAMLDRLGEVFGYNNQDEMTMSMIAPQSTSLDSSTPHDSTNFDIFGTSF
jgi:hypothetical protein